MAAMFERPQPHPSESKFRRIALRLARRRVAPISGVEEIKRTNRLGQEAVVVASFLLATLQHRLDSLGVGYGNAPDVEEMNCGADGPEARVPVEPEAREQNLERDPVSDVRELRAVEIESHGLLWALAWSGDPDKSGIAIDESPDEPRTGQPIHPGSFPRRPDAPLVASRVDLL